VNAVDRANKAKAVLESPVFQDAFNNLRSEYRRINESRDSTPEAAEKVRQRLMALQDFEVDLKAAINSGKLEVFRLDQDEKRKKSPLRFFR
jgi:hypothetical protein